MQYLDQHPDSCQASSMKHSSFGARSKVSHKTKAKQSKGVKRILAKMECLKQHRSQYSSGSFNWKMWKLRKMLEANPASGYKAARARKQTCSGRAPSSSSASNQPRLAAPQARNSTTTLLRSKQSLPRPSSRGKYAEVQHGEAEEARVEFQRELKRKLEIARMSMKDAETAEKKARAKAKAAVVEDDEYSYYSSEEDIPSPPLSTPPRSPASSRSSRSSSPRVRMVRSRSPSASIPRSQRQDVGHLGTRPIKGVVNWEKLEKLRIIAEDPLL